MGAHPSGGKSGRWIRRGILLVVLMPVLVFVGSNLVMRSAWGRGKFEGRLAVRTRLFWTVDEASWSPWGGLRLGKLKGRASGPEAYTIPPVFEIAEVRVHPYWREMLSGRLRIRELRVVEPQGKLPIELLVQLMRSDGQVEAARLGVAEGTQPAPAVVPDAGQAGTAQEPVNGTAANPEPAAHPADGQPPAGPVLPAEPEAEAAGRLIVERGDLQVYSIAAPARMLRVAGVAVDVPFSGGEADGLLAADELRFAGTAWTGPLHVPVRWKEGVMEWPVGQFEWNGLTVQTAGAVRMRGRLLGTVELRAFAPRVSPQAMPGWESLMFTTGAVEVRARLSGDMIRPVTWQGNLVAGVAGVQLVHRERGESLGFDQARFVTDLRGGVLQVVDAALKGERLSLFANGLVVLDGRVYGVARVVAAPDIAEEFTRVAMGSMVTPDRVHSWMAPLVTPDRYYRDIHAQGTVQKWELDLGPNGEWMDAGQALHLMTGFVRREEAEEVKENAPRQGGTGP